MPSVRVDQVPWRSWASILPLSSFVVPDPVGRKVRRCVNRVEGSISPGRWSLAAPKLYGLKNECRPGVKSMLAATDPFGSAGRQKLLVNILLTANLSHILPNHVKIYFPRTSRNLS